MPMFPKHPVPSEPPQGVRFHTTSLGICVAEVHYTADPKKRTKSWKTHYSKGMPVRDWHREYEIDWSVADGKPVYPDYEPTKHLAQGVLSPMPGVSYTVGWDFGLNPGAVFLQVTPLGQVRVLKCLNPTNCALVKFAPMVLEMMVTLTRVCYAACRSWDETMAHARDLIAGGVKFWADALRVACALTLKGFPQFVQVGDPAGSYRSSNDARSGYDTLRLFGIEMKEGAQNPQTRRDAVTNLLVAPDLAEGVPALLVSFDPANELFISGMNGKYAYAENAEEGSPLKDKYSHIQDAFQYPCTYLFPVANQKAAGGARSTRYDEALGGVPMLPETAYVPPDPTWTPLEEAETLPQRAAAIVGRRRGRVDAASPPSGWNPHLQSQLRTR